MKPPHFTAKKQTLRRMLFGYMCILVILLCALLLAGLFLIGNFTGTKQRVAKTLEFQTELFERQVDTYYESLAVMCVQLSYNTTEILETYLDDNHIVFQNLNNSEKHIENLQEGLIDMLRHKLWEADCTGAFIMLDAQVNSNVKNAETSRTGIYLQRNNLDVSDTRVLLYRGLAQTGKDHSCMPHRKWRLEFSTDLFPNFEEIKSTAAFPLNQCYRITDVVLLPGTDQHVMLMTIPLLSADGTFYGLCGFELNEGYFKQIFAQPSELDHAIFCISKSSSGLELSESSTLSAGILNEYYLEPHGSFASKDFGSGLTEYWNENEAYIGITLEIPLCPNECSSAISVLIPKQDYTNMLTIDLLRVVILIVGFAAAVVGLSMFFARQYLRPIKDALNRIRKKEYIQDTAYASEIKDLFVFLADQDRTNEAELNKLRREKADAMTAATELQSKFDETAKQNERLAYSRKDEIDPYDFENFKNGLQMLTGKERQVFDFYMQGKGVKEIIAALGLQESTVRFHNKNIYSKLGVHSLKQLLRYAAILKQEEASNDSSTETHI